VIGGASGHRRADAQLAGDAAGVMEGDVQPGGGNQILSLLAEREGEPTPAEKKAIADAAGEADLSGWARAILLAATAK